MSRQVPLYPIQFDDLPRPIYIHLERRIRERKIPPEDLAKWKVWKATGPLAPEGDWYKDFGSYSLAGKGPYPKTVLSPDMAGYGVKLAMLVLVEDFLG